MRRSIFLLSLCGLACTSDPTQLVVLVDSNLKVPEHVRAIRASIGGDEGEIFSENYSCSHNMTCRSPSVCSRGSAIPRSR